MGLPGGQKSCKYVFVAQKIRFKFENAFSSECFKRGGGGGCFKLKRFSSPKDISHYRCCLTLCWQLNPTQVKCACNANDSGVLTTQPKKNLYWWNIGSSLHIGMYKIQCINGEGRGSFLKFGQVYSARPLVKNVYLVSLYAFH